MCGISGLLDLEGRFASSRWVEAVKRMTDAQAHRGPDDAGFFVAHPVYLGFRRLSILDLDTGRQPQANEDAQVVVVFNGEIYNFEALRARLVANGHTFRTRSDTEVLVHLYEEKGEALVDDLSGMFAFALWDRRRRRLVLARDRMGQKPLHYAWDGRVLAFASELTGLMQARDAWTLSATAVSKYLLYDAVPAPDTVVAEARKLGPGEVMVVDADGSRTLRRYWALPFPERHDLVEPGPALAAFEQAFVPAVEHHLVSDVPLGVFLSGGLDSTAVLDAMARVKPVDQIRTFAVGFDDPSFDESGPAEAVARAVGCRHHLERLSADVMLDLAPRIVDEMDEPLADPSFVPTWLLSRFTRRHVTVALGGDGGDELFLGYPTFVAHRLATWARAVLPPPASRGLLALAHALVPVSTANVSADYQLKRFLKGLAYGEWERHAVWIGGQPPDEQAPLFRPGALPPGFLAQGVLADVARVVDDLGPRHPLDVAAGLYARLYLENLILVKVDRASMANSLEVRAPFLDPEVVAVACRVAPALKLRGRTTKWLLRRYLAGRIPADVLARPKKGFGIPLSAWLRGPLRPWLADTLSPERLAPLGLFEPAAVARLVAQHVAGRREHRKVLWSLAVLSEWARRHADRLRAPT